MRERTKPEALNCTDHGGTPIVRKPGVDPDTSFRSPAVHLRSHRSLTCSTPDISLVRVPIDQPKLELSSMESTLAPLDSVPERAVARILQYAEQTFY